MTRSFVRLNEQLPRFLLLASFMMAFASVTTAPSAAGAVDVHDQFTYVYDDSANLPMLVE